MKKRWLAVTLSVMMGTAMLAGCGGKQESKESEAKSETKSEVAKSEKSTSTSAKHDVLIGVSIPSADHGWTAGVAYYAQQKMDELGLKEGTQYKILTADSVNDQANDIEELIQLKCTEIVLLPQNDEVTTAAQKILDAGIKLVVFDRKVDVDFTAYVAGDNPGLGTEGAKYLGKALGGKGTIAVMSAPSLGSVSVERTEAFEAEMKKSYPDIKLVEVTSEGFTQENGLTMASDMLTTYKELDAVFSIDDEPSLGILQAIKEANRKDIKYISGGGGAQAWFDKIKNEKEITCFTETYSPSMIGDAIAAAYDIAQGKDVEKSTIIPPTTVDKNNVDSFLDPKSPY